MKVAIVTGATKSKDSVRGIGVHNSELFKALRLGSNKNLNSPDVTINDDLSKFEVVHFTSFRPFFRSLPLLKPKNTKFVLTIHDLIPLLYPNVYKPGVRGKINYWLNKYLIKKYVNAIITISETSKKDIVRFLSVDPDIVHVVYLAPKNEYKKIEGKNNELLRKELNLPKKFVMYYGDINYNKNIQVLISACKKIKMPLVIAGKQALEVEDMDLNHPENSHLKKIYSDLINPKLVLRLGYVTDETANKVLNLSTCLVQPSLYEGFGLSVIHAFASGCPVIASKTQALVEIGGDACLYFDSTSVNDLVGKINFVANNQSVREEYIKKGFENVKKYTWEKTANETLDVYEKI